MKTEKFSLSIFFLHFCKNFPTLFSLKLRYRAHDISRRKETTRSSSLRDRVHHPPGETSLVSQCALSLSWLLQPLAPLSLSVSFCFLDNTLSLSLPLSLSRGFSSAPRSFVVIIRVRWTVVWEKEREGEKEKLREMKGANYVEKTHAVVVESRKDPPTSHPTTYIAIRMEVWTTQLSEKNLAIFSRLSSFRLSLHWTSLGMNFLYRSNDAPRKVYSDNKKSSTSYD